MPIASPTHSLIRCLASLTPSGIAYRRILRTKGSAHSTRHFRTPFRPDLSRAGDRRIPAVGSIGKSMRDARAASGGTAARPFRPEGLTPLNHPSRLCTMENLDDYLVSVSGDVFRHQLLPWPDPKINVDVALADLRCGNAWCSILPTRDTAHSPERAAVAAPPLLPRSSSPGKPLQRRLIKTAPGEMECAPTNARSSSS